MNQQKNFYNPGPWSFENGQIVDSRGEVVNLSEPHNGQLVAAAPKMLEACLLALNLAHLQGCGQEIRNLLIPAIDAGLGIEDPLIVRNNTFAKNVFGYTIEL